MSKKSKNSDHGVVRATHGSPDKQLSLGERKIQCYVLPDGTALLSGRGMQEALTLGQSHGTKLRVFLNNKQLQPFISAELAMALSEPIKFIRPGRGGVTAQGYEATVLPKICRAVLDARRAGALDGNEKMLAIAMECELLIAAFSDIGIVALIYEITGYERDKKEDFYQQILAAYVAPELLPWAKKFPDEYYKEIFRLNRWTYDPTNTKRPQIVGKWTNEIVYNLLPPGVVDELKKRAPKNEKGRRVVHLHRWLTPEIGNPHLRDQLLQIITLMNISPNWRKFKEHFARKFGQQRMLDLSDED